MKKAIIFFVFFFFFTQASFADSDDPVIDTPLPAFELPLLFDFNKTMTEKNLKGQIAIVNVWASHCPACRYEHPLWLKVQKEYAIPVYGIDYRDDPERAKSYLKSEGNPYKAVLADLDGEVGNNFGIYGTPETFVIDQKGIIRLHYFGVITEEAWKEKVWPAILVLKK